jgi:hypothetical protein
MLSRCRQTFKEKNGWGCRREVPVDILQKYGSIKIHTQ